MLYADEMIFCAEHLVDCPEEAVTAASMGLPAVVLLNGRYWTGELPSIALLVCNPYSAGVVTGARGGCDGVGAIALPVVAISLADIDGCLAVTGGKLGFLTRTLHPKPTSFRKLSRSEDIFLLLCACR